MGMYDTLNFNCPECGHITSEQTKIGECKLNEYSLDTAPLLVIAAVNNYGKIGDLYCQKCNKQLELEVRFIATPRVKDYSPDDEDLRVV